MAQTTDPISPMVETIWGQGAPYNDCCPKINGQQSLAGCGATAVAQILYRYQRPAAGFGHAKYDDVDMDFAQHPIDWDLLKADYRNVGEGPETQAVANLIHVVGAAMKMHYRPQENGSSPYNHPSMLWGLQHHLHISPKSRYRRRRFYSTTEWIEMLNKELEAERPVYYRGDHTVPDNSKLWGHIFVIDGRDGEGNYHFNFGHANPNQIKYASLNLINQGNGTWPGVYGVCYHYRQAMVTDFVPMEGLTDGDFDKTAIMLELPIVLDNNPEATNIEVKDKVNASFQIRYVNFKGGSCQFTLGFYQDGELRGTSSTIRPFTPEYGGKGANSHRNFGLPKTLENGDYEMSVISRDDENAPWVRGWDNAPNRIPVSVRNGVFTFHMPKNHTLHSGLYLEDGIREIEGTKKNGKTFEFTVCNPSENNFEDTLRISITNNGITKHSKQVTAVYEGQKVTYRYFVADTIAGFNGRYTVEASYWEANSKDENKWMPLTEYGMGVGQPTATLTNGIEIYSAEGILLKRMKGNCSEQDYSQLLAELPKGIYLIRDKNGTRKFAKRR